MFSTRYALLFFVAAALLFSVAAKAEDATAPAPQAEAPPAETPPAPPLRIVGISPQPGEAFQGHLSLFFSEAPSFSNLDAAIQFEPALTGITVLEGNALRFRADAMDSAVVYTLRLGPGLMENTALTIEDPTQSWKLSGTPLAVSECRLVQEGEAQLDFALKLTHLVEREALQAAISATDRDGAPLTWQLGTEQSKGREWNILVTPGQRPIRLILDGSLQDTQHGLRLGLPTTIQWPAATLAPPEMVWNREQGRNRIEMRFAQAIEGRVLRDFLRLVDPASGNAVHYSLQSSAFRDLHQVDLGSIDTSISTLEVQISDRLPTSNRARLEGPVQARLEPTASPLQLQYHYWEMAGLEAFELRFELNQEVDIATLRENLRITPEVAIESIRSSGYLQYSVLADFEAEANYTLHLDTGIKSVDGVALLEEGQQFALNQTPYDASVEIGYDGMVYFPRASLGPLEVKARNVPEAEIVLYRLFPNNITRAMDNIYNGRTDWEFNERLAREVARTTLEFPEERNAVHRGALDMAELAGELKGVFSIRAENSYGWLNSKIVVWTDMGMLAHWQEKELLIAVHHLSTLETLPGVKVSVYSNKNQLIAAGVTDNDGVVRFHGLEPAQGAPMVAVAETLDDYSFLKLEPRYDDPNGFTAEMPPYKAGGYDAFLYADRNLYRPGETAHLRWLVRDDAFNAAAQVPLQFRVYNPQGTELQQETVILSDFGTGGLDWTSEADMLTGPYRMTLNVPGDEQPIGEIQLQLEEFVPNRIEAEVKTERSIWRAGEAQSIDVLARHLFGAPASGRRAEARVILRKGAFEAEGWEGYRFTNDEKFAATIHELGEAETNEDGLARFGYTHSPEQQLSFPATVTVRGDVHELGGRAVHGATEALLLPEGPVLGLRVDLAEDKRTLVVDAAALTAEGAAYGALQGEVILERQTWSHYIRRMDGNNEVSWESRFSELERTPINLTAGKGTVQLPFDSYGYFRVRFQAEGAAMTSAVLFYRYGDRIDPVDQERPSLIKLSLDQDRYALGETVHLRIESPFDGKAYVALQGASLQRMLVADVVDGEGRVSFTAEERSLPNLWAEVTVVHLPTLGMAQAHPYSGFNMINVPVYDSTRALAVALNGVPDQAQPGETVSVRVSVTDHLSHGQPAEVTLAAVDDGIHAILGYENPDPLAWFFRSRRADFRRTHYYDQAAYDFSPVQIGGDGIARRLGKGDAPIDENWIKPVALWSGVIETDASGEAEIPIELPEFNGRLRLVAVAANATAQGATHGTMTVQRPQFMRISAPRFTAPGDQYECRVVVFNRSEEAMHLAVNWDASGAQSGNGEQVLEVPARGEAQFTALFRAADAIGQGELQFHLAQVAEDGQHEAIYTESLLLPVRPPATYRTEHQARRIEPGETASFTTETFQDNDKLRVRFTASAHPGTALRPTLEKLIRYPYGCLEQTVSRAFPLYLLHAIEAPVSDLADEATTVQHQVQSAISRIFTMQTPSGGLAFWPGTSEPYAYGSVYALHFLNTVKHNGAFTIPARGLERLQAYVREVARDELDDSADGLYRKAYAIYVLGIDGDSEALDLIPRFDQIAIPTPARQLLAAAKAQQSGDTAAARDYLANTPTEDFRERLRYGSLNSPVRNAAVEVLSFTSLGEGGERLGQLVEILTRAAATEPLTTHEGAFVVAALSAYFDTLELNPDAAQATITIEQAGHNHEARSLQGAAPMTMELEGTATTIRIENTGSTAVYGSHGIEGVPVEAELSAESQGMSIERSYRNTDGEAVAMDQLHQGETYIVALKLQLESALENVVVSDRLPAGLEILNPRLDSDTLTLAGIEESATPSHFEVRDDLYMAAFDRLGQGVHNVYYAVRATTPGAFQAPPARVECMYDLSVRGNTAPGVVSIASLAPES